MKTINEVIERIKEDRARAQLVSTSSSNPYMTQFFDGVESECEELLQFINEEK